MKAPAKGVELDAQREEQALAVVTREKAHLALTLAAKQLEAEADAKPDALALVTVENDEEYAMVTAIRADVRTAKDAAVLLRQAAAKPWKGVATSIEEMFRPYIKALETIEADYKGKLEGFQRAKLEAEAKAKADALEAAQADDSEGVTQALTRVAVASVPTGGGAVRASWKVSRVVRDLLPDEWWCPDTAKIEAVAKAHKDEEPPVIPGVIFERDVSVAVQRSKK